jgi:hypothetical protein
MRAVDLQKILRFLPDILRYDRLVFTGIEFIIMLDIPGINRVIEDAVRKPYIMFLCQHIFLGGVSSQA